MKPSWKRATTGLILLLSGFGLSQSAQARTLDVAQTVSLSLEHSRSVEAAEWGEVKAHAEARQAFLALFPKVSLSAGYTRLDQVPYVEFDMSAFTGGSGGSTSDPCAEIDESTLPAGYSLEMAQGLCQLIMGWMTVDTGGDSVSRITMGLQDNYFIKASAEQVLFAGGAMQQAHAARRDLHQASEEQLRLARQEAAHSAEQSFYGLMMARNAAQVTAEAQATMDSYVDNLQALVDVGMASRADLLAAQAQGSQAKLDAMRAAHGAQLAELMFKVTLGIPKDEELELVLTEDPLEMDLQVERETLLVQALAHRPDLAALDASLSAMRHVANTTWASWLPAVVAVGNLNWKNPNYALEPEWYSSADITLAASWTLWDQGAALFGHRAARAGRLQLQAQRTMAAEMMEVELESTLSAFDEAREELIVAQTGVEQSEESYRLQRDRFDQGMVNNTELLAAQAALSGARLAGLQAETGVRMAHASLRKALGMEPEVGR